MEEMQLCALKGEFNAEPKSNCWRIRGVLVRVAAFFLLEFTGKGVVLMTPSPSSMDIEVFEHPSQIDRSPSSSGIESNCVHKCPGGQYEYDPYI